MRMFKLLAVPALFLSLTSCAMVTSPVSGFLYSSVKAPIDATSNAASTKVGRAKCMSILGLFATGDASISTAAKSAGITKIHHVDFENFSVLGFYATFETVVYGE
jgi:hypothetical protein